MKSNTGWKAFSGRKNSRLRTTIQPFRIMVTCSFVSERCMTQKSISLMQKLEFNMEKMWMSRQRWKCPICICWLSKFNPKNENRGGCWSRRSDEVYEWRQPCSKLWMWKSAWRALWLPRLWWAFKHVPPSKLHGPKKEQNIDRTPTTCVSRNKRKRGKATLETI